MDYAGLSRCFGFLTKIADINFNDVALTTEVVTPYAIIYYVSSEDLTWVPQE
jgi:hypothetical protein